MKVYLDDGDEKRLLGRADIPENVGPTIEVPLFGASSVIRENYIIGTVTHLSSGGGAPAAERVVLVAPGQAAELLPGWSPIAS